jgi:uncharacterized protein involved in exopolysaccharide biosynthesis
MMPSLARLPRVAAARALAVASSIVLCVLAALIYESHKPIVYEAAARVAITQSEAKSNAEADAVTARAKALATSRTVVEQAVATVKVPRDADTVATNTTVVRLGTSPIVEISVRDSDPSIAAALANGISDGVVRYLDESARGDTPALIARLSQQVDALNAQYQKLVRSVAAPEQIAVVAEQRSALQQQLLSVEASDAQRTRPAVVDKALVPIAPLASARTQEAALAGLLGLIIGIGIVAAAAALRPMASGPVAVAHALGASHLGELKLNRVELDAADEATVARIVARSRRLDADTVMLVGTRPSMDTERLSIAIGDIVTERVWHRQQRTSTEPLRTPEPRADQPLEIIASSPDAIANSAWNDKQVIVIGVVPYVVSQASLRHIGELADSCGWPLAGFVTHSRRRLRREHRETASGSQQVETTPTQASRADVDADLDAEVARLTRWADLQTRPK